MLLRIISEKSFNNWKLILFKYWTEHGIGFNYATSNVLFFNHNFSVSQSDRLSALLPDETKQHLDSVLPKNQFEIAYRLDCRNLCADFQEDIQFRFSFGITALMERFLGRKGVKTVLTGKGNTVSFCKVFVVMLFSSLKKKSLALSSLNRICLTKKKKISMKVIELIWENLSYFTLNHGHPFYRFPDLYPASHRTIRSWSVWLPRSLLCPPGQPWELLSSAEWWAISSSSTSSS